jgi:multidrug transporter EmrE-like cation transporter
MSGFVYLILAIVANSAANVIFKIGSAIEGFTVRKGSLLGLGLAIGLVNTVSFIKSLETLDLGVAFPIFSAASIVIIALASYLLLQEPMSGQKAIGLAILCVGFAVLWKA